MKEHDVLEKTVIDMTNMGEVGTNAAIKQIEEITAQVIDWQRRGGNAPHERHAAIVAFTQNKYGDETFTVDSVRLGSPKIMINTSRRLIIGSIKNGTKSEAAAICEALCCCIELLKPFADSGKERVLMLLMGQIATVGMHYEMQLRTGEKE